MMQTLRRRPQGTTLAGTTPPGNTGADQPSSRHGPVAQLLIAWAPLSLILVAYAIAYWVNVPLTDGSGAASNRLGFELNVQGPARADEAVFGAVPSVSSQELLVDGGPHWYDAAGALVYVTHFVSIPFVTGLVWFRSRDRFGAWIAAVLVFTALGVAGYVVYPAAPPWLASERSDIGQVARISGLGWDYLHLDLVERLVVEAQAGSNPVAAMPSLHAGCALLVALFLWPVLGTLWRGLLATYAVLMAATLVYSGEHYVVDVAAGWAVAAAAAAAAAALLRHRSATSSRE